MKRLPILLSFIAIAALSASLAFWAIQLFKPPQRALEEPPVQAAAEPNMDAAGSLFGGQATVVAVSNYQLRGVVAAVAGKLTGGAAILSFDGKPAQALAVGAEVVPGVRVQEVQPTFVLLSEGGVTKRIELSQDAVKATDSGVQRTPIPLPAQALPPTPMAAAPTPVTPVPTALSPQDVQLQQLQQQQQQLLMQQQQLQQQLQQQQQAPPLPASRMGGMPTTMSPPQRQ